MPENGAEPRWRDEKRIKSRRLLNNTSYFAFTATPKPKTLEMFGIAQSPDAEGKVKHKPFHSYTMKQAIQERFILDVLRSYTPVSSYYRLVKKVEDDPEFDKKKARKKLRRYVESHDHAIGHKPEPDIDRLSRILKAFNEQFGTLFKDSDRVFQRIREDIAPKVAADPAFQNALRNTPAAARIEHDKVLARVMLTLLKDDTQVYKQFVENEAFHRAVSDLVFSLSSTEAA